MTCGGSVTGPTGSQWSGSPRRDPRERHGDGGAGCSRAAGSAGHAFSAHVRGAPAPNAHAPLRDGGGTSLAAWVGTGSAGFDGKTGTELACGARTNPRSLRMRTWWTEVRKAPYRLTERDLDLILLEELSGDTGFLAWFADRIGLGECALLAAAHSASADGQ